MDYDSTLVRIEQYAWRLLSADLDQLIYHNFRHTKYVVERCAEIASYYHLDKQESFIVSAAAWLHDLGYLNGEPLGHEKRSVDLLYGLKETVQLPESISKAISGCILATALPQKPATLLECILCDADLYHLGTSEFKECDAQMHLEVEIRLKQHIPSNRWLMATIDFLMSHQYHTSYCQQKLSAQKLRNVALLKERLSDTHL